MKKIIDEFTDRPVSRARKQQLRRMRDGLCKLCGKPVATTKFCLAHAVREREKNRKRHGCRQRNRSLTYQLEALFRP